MEPAEAPLASCLMASHPETRERIARIEGLARRYGKQCVRPDSDAFEYLKGRFDRQAQSYRDER